MCNCLLALVALGLVPWTAVSQSDFSLHHAGLYQYDARMSFLKAGELTLNLNRAGELYEVSGQFQTSRAMSRYYSWSGLFAAKGRWESAGPITEAYMARTMGKDDDLKIVLNTPDSARVLDSAQDEFVAITKPAGIDLISALFFTPSCYSGGVVHDGEDVYQLELHRQKKARLRGGKAYFKGEVMQCHYHVRDHKNRKRQVIVSLAEINGATVAVQVRAKIPLLPDAIFKLKMPLPEANDNGPTLAISAG